MWDEMRDGALPRALWDPLRQAKFLVKQAVLRCRYSNSDQLRDLLGQLLHDLEHA